MIACFFRGNKRLKSFFFFFSFPERNLAEFWLKRASSCIACEIAAQGYSRHFECHNILSYSKKKKKKQRNKKKKHYGIPIAISVFWIILNCGDCVCVCMHTHQHVCTWMQVFIEAKGNGFLWSWISGFTVDCEQPNMHVSIWAKLLLKASKNLS